MAASVEEVLAIAERVLGAAGVAHALIGGCARNVYAPPRATRDVDLAVLANAAEYARIAADLRAAGFTRVATDALRAAYEAEQALRTERGVRSAAVERARQR